MNVRGIGLAVGLALFGAAPAMGQMWFFPDYAVPSANGAPSTFLAATYGRGLNESSGKTDGFGAVVGRTGTRVGVMGGAGVITGEGDRELTVGAQVGVDLLAEGAPTQLSVQGGIGYMDVDFFGESLTLLRFPIGLALKARIETTSGGSITPWIMPRLNIARLSGGGESDTEMDFGASGGVTFTAAGGFGVHAALDLLVPGEDVDSVWFLGLGVHYAIGR